MSRKLSHRSVARLHSGFTLVELLIVVIILAILAAIVVPQFGAATGDAKLSALDSNLANMRAAIDLYYQQHGEYPGNVTAVGTACAAGPGGATGTGAAQDDQAFIDQMTRYTNVLGESCTKKDTAFKDGPYLKKDVLPNMPMTEINTLNLVFAGALGMVSTVTNGGWKFDSLTGQFIADHSGYDDH